MPGIEASKLPALLGGLGFIISVILILIYIIRARKMYWDTAALSKRQRRKLERERPRIIFLIACLITCAVTALLALTINIFVAVFFAVIAFLILVIVFSASGRGGGNDGPGDLPSAYGFNH